MSEPSGGQAETHKVARADEDPQYKEQPEVGVGLDDQGFGH